MGSSWVTIYCWKGHVDMSDWGEKYSSIWIPLTVLGFLGLVYQLGFNRDANQLVRYLADLCLAAALVVLIMGIIAGRNASKK